MPTSRCHSILCKISSTGHLSLSHTPFSSHSCHQAPTRSSIAESVSMYWTQWKNRQLPLGDHKRNISLLPSTCACLPRLSILHESLSTQPAKAGSLKSPQVSWHSHPHVTKFSQWPRPASLPEDLSVLWFITLNVWDRQDRTQTSSFTAAVQTILVPFSKLQIQLVTFHPFHWNSPHDHC